MSSSHEIERELLRLNLRLRKLYAFLIANKYVFTNASEAMPGPHSQTEQMLDEIEKVAGRVPEALKCFYRVVGSINFSGSHPNWTGCDLPDPLVVYPLSAARDELDDFLDDPEAYKETFETFRIPVAPDALHKAGVSGGMWYGIPVPCNKGDPPLLEEPHETTFLKYLERAMAWGCFPGLEQAGHSHSWPLGDLQDASRKS